MVGGGPGAFIGPVHRAAAAVDGEIELVAGAFSSDPDRSRAEGSRLGLAADRCYGTYMEMAEQEASLPESERIAFVSIVTPNRSHFAVARTFLEAGIPVVCDKPLTTTVADAESLCRLAANRDLPFMVTYNYTGYPMVKEARHLVRSGALGEPRKVIVEYSQGWLATALEATGHVQAVWRQDPERAGSSSAMADIGSHAHSLLRYVSGLGVRRVLADVSTLVPGRVLEDDVNVLLKLDGDARGVMIVSQISTGEANGLGLRIYGSEGSLTWHQERPEELWLRRVDVPAERRLRGDPYLCAAARHATRLPPGHPEGFIEAFANLYRGFARSLAARLDGVAPHPADLDTPSVQDGARGVDFVERILRSGRAGEWIDVDYDPPDLRTDDG